MVLEYSEKVMDHFTNPRNVGELKNASGHAMEGSPACGDMISIDLVIDDETKVLKDIKFKSYGCASNIATASMVTELAKGKTVDEIKKIDWKNVEGELGGLPQVKVHCSILAVNTLRKAIQDYEVKHGVKQVEKSMEERVDEELKNVVNPNTGKPITENKLIVNRILMDDKVIIELDLCDEDLFKENITEEISEHLGKMFKTVNVLFVK